MDVVGLCRDPPEKAWCEFVARRGSRPHPDERPAPQPLPAADVFDRGRPGMNAF
ncbi:hypothetical protein [Streptomyces sp. NPDC059371]|uniref:hypothetical protein n=1 Tax=Streptomyces sp. NPDC059371 TaxID=3346812 RepID=UPI0036798392